MKWREFSEEENAWAETVMLLKQAEIFTDKRRLRFCVAKQKHPME